MARKRTRDNFLSLLQSFSYLPIRIVADPDLDRHHLGLVTVHDEDHFDGLGSFLILAVTGDVIGPESRASRFQQL